MVQRHLQIVHIFRRRRKKKKPRFGEGEVDEGKEKVKRRGKK